jgi:hypothetical protein
MADTKPATRSPEPAPSKRRARGPNKPKPGAIEVRTEAFMPQAEILKLLESHAAAVLGAGAAGMELQVNTGEGGWQQPAAIGIAIRFATASRPT